jgi:hypothetical protein
VNGVAELLSEMAEDARTYGAVDPAVRVLRRRRRMARLAPLTVAAAVVVALVVAYAAVGRGTLDRTIGDPRPLPWLPDTWTVATATTPSLPTDRGVGPGAYVYMAADPRTWPTGAHPRYLVTVDGGQYRLPDEARGYGLSPDGRWLLVVTEGRYVLRDLTGAEAKVLDRHGGRSVAVGWSGDSAVLALQQTFGAEGTPDLEAAATVVELPSGGTRSVGLTPYPGEFICGVRPDGDLLLCPWDSVAGHVVVRLVDGRTGNERSHMDADVTDVLSEDQRKADEWAPAFGQQVTALPDGDTLVVRASRYIAFDDARPRATVADDLLVLDRRDGRVLRWLDMPEQRVPWMAPEGSEERAAIAERWQVASALPEGILLAHYAPLPGDGRWQTLAGLELLDPVTGSRTEVMSGAGSGFVVDILPRGDARAMI